MAYVFKFISLTKAKLRSKGYVTVAEQNGALEFLLKETQRYYFGLQIREIQKGQCPSGISKLSPFLNENSMLRVSGRLKHSSLPFRTNHPILLPKHGHLTELIVNHYHKLYLHPGTRTLQSLLSRSYWILSCRQVIKRTISQCLVCYKLNSSPLSPLGGAFFIKESSRRNSKVIKAYICLFVCLSTKAIHLEVVSSLSADAFLAAFHRFIARRDLCSSIFSDCGRNFIGAAHYFRDLITYFKDRSNQSQLILAASTLEIKWHFNPPSGPNFGGIWEAGIKATKFHLRRIVGERALTYEEFTTILKRVEAILNSRPLCALTSDIDDIDYLTPGHFIIGAPMCSPPERELTNLSGNLVTRWQLLQQIIQLFWSRWSNEYLHTLQQRTKWYQGVNNVKIDDILFVVKDNTSPLCWRIARIVAINPGKDGVVRVVKTRTGTLTRPVNKLVSLPPQTC